MSPPASKARASHQGSRDDPQFYSRCARHRRTDGPINPNLPIHSAVPTSAGISADFGGRSSAETLMPLILDRGAYDDAQRDPAFQTEIDYAQTYYRPAVPALFRRATDGTSRRCENLLQTRRAQSHRLAQDQQRARPSWSLAAWARSASSPTRRRTRGRRHRDAMRAVRARMRGLYGRGRRRAAAAQRDPHGNADGQDHAVQSGAR